MRCFPIDAGIGRWREDPLRHSQQQTPSLPIPAAVPPPPPPPPPPPARAAAAAAAAAEPTPGGVSRAAASVLADPSSNSSSSSSSSKAKRPFDSMEETKEGEEAPKEGAPSRESLFEDLRRDALTVCKKQRKASVKLGKTFDSLVDALQVRDHPR